MTPVPIQIPDDARLTNHLYRSTDPELLDADLVTIGLRNGYFIDVGWYPEHDPRGRYVIRVFWQYGDDQQIPQIEKHRVDDVVLCAEQLAEHFSSVAVPHSIASTTRIEASA
jgi:hypothetical protein